jgi:hypothetical protein
MRVRSPSFFVFFSLIIAACAESDGPTAPNAPELLSRGALAPAAAVQLRHQEDLMAVPGVVGVGLGATDSGRPAVVVLAERGGVAGLPASLGGVPVRVMVTGEIWALQQEPRKKCENPPCNGGGGGGGGGGGDVDPTARFPLPVPIGVSTGHPAITAGTIGARVKKGSNVYALSNNHVYAASNTATIGDAVIQPGTFDGGSSPADDIGTLADFQPIDFSGGNNVIDAAIALSSTANLDNSTPSNGYGTPKSTTTTAAVNMRVMKYGRTTQQTKGRISVINATVNVNYGGPGVARFVNQIVIGGGGFSAGGDSGSLIVVEKGGDKLKPVGLLYAGSSNSTIANPIGPVLSEFGVTIDGS